MPDFAANLSTLFIERPFLDRFAAASSHGFDAVEFASTDGGWPQGIAGRLTEHRLSLVAYHLMPGPGSEGLARIADPEGVAAFRDAARVGLERAISLRPRFVVFRAGAAPGGGAPAEIQRSVVDNLRFAARYGIAAGLHLLLEPVDTTSLPGAYPHRTAQALALIDATGARNLSLNYDVCHMQAMGEPVRDMIKRHLPRISHIQIAGYPERREPLNGAIDFDDLLTHIDRIGHRGWVGCDYHPAAGTEGGLGWLARHQRLSPSGRSLWGMPRAALEETSLGARLTTTH